jgi:hypothetical protein
MSDQYRICVIVTDDGGAEKEFHVLGCCQQAALEAVWDEEGARLDDWGEARRVDWSEHEDGSEGEAPATCNECAGIEDDGEWSGDNCSDNYVGATWSEENGFDDTTIKVGGES